MEGSGRAEGREGERRGSDRTAQPQQLSWHAPRCEGRGQHRERKEEKVERKGSRTPRRALLLSLVGPCGRSVDQLIGLQEAVAADPSWTRTGSKRQRLDPTSSA